MRQAETTADGQQNVSDYTYDRNGNLLARLESRFGAQAGGEAGGHMGEMGKGDKAAETKTATYTYDPFNQLTGYKTMNGTSASYSYYAGGLRSSKTVNGAITQYYYDGQNVVNDVTDGTVSTNLRGAGYISRKTGDNAPNYFLYNIHTDVTQLANENGTVVKNYDYDAWGTPTKDEGEEINNPIRYAGEYLDDESGMIYLRARYYQPEVGRFVSEDPVKDGMNWYEYCYSNPTNLFDPSGLGANRQLRELVGETTGSISWSEKNKTATVKIDGKEKKYVVGDGGAVYSDGARVGYIENDRIIVWDESFYNDFDIVGTITIASYFDQTEAFYIPGTEKRFDGFSGHAYIEYTPLGGRTDTYATHPAYEKYGTGAGMYKNFEPDRNLMNNENTTKYSKKITRNQKVKMDKEINNPKNNTWSEWNNCTAFATKVFKAATGTNLNARTPKALKDQIKYR